MHWHKLEISSRHKKQTNLQNKKLVEAHSRYMPKKTVELPNLNAFLLNSF